MKWFKRKPRASERLALAILEHQQRLDNLPTVCLHCRFSAESVVENRVLCKRYPPSAPKTDHSLAWDFPLVIKWDGCAEFQPTLREEITNIPERKDTTQ